jgi:hypothetical protein
MCVTWSLDKSMVRQAELQRVVDERHMLIYQVVGNVILRMWRG